MWRLAVICVRVTLIFFSAQVAVLIGSGLAHPGENSDPFAPYKAMMPGHWAVAVKEPPCDLQTIPGFIETPSCEIYPVHGPIDVVTSSTFNGRFDQTLVIANDLVVGDVVRHWGRPDAVAKDNHAFYLEWSDQGLYGLIDPVGRFTYMLRVDQLIIGLQPYNHP
jgi:hypothetical protein